MEVIGSGIWAGRTATWSSSCQRFRISLPSFKFEFLFLPTSILVLIHICRTVLSKKFKLMNTSERENQPSVAVNKDLFPWAYAKFRDQVTKLQNVSCFIFTFPDGGEWGTCGFGQQLQKEKENNLQRGVFHYHCGVYLHYHYHFHFHADTFTITFMLIL